MKLGDFKKRLRSAPKEEPKEWKKPLPVESMNCPECLGTGKADAKVGEGPPLRTCETCGGSGLQLSGVPKRKQTKSDRAKEVAKALDRGVIKVPAGTRVEALGPIKGRRADLLIIDDPIKERGEVDDAVDALARFREGGVVGAVSRSRGKTTTDFIEDLLDTLGTEDKEPATTTCLECGIFVRPHHPEDHCNDCSLVTMKKCRVCAKEMGLCFKHKFNPAWICKPCARKKFAERGKMPL